MPRCIWWGTPTRMQPVFPMYPSAKMHAAHLHAASRSMRWLPGMRVYSSKLCLMFWWSCRAMRVDMACA